MQEQQSGAGDGDMPAQGILIQDNTDYQVGVFENRIDNYDGTYLLHGNETMGGIKVTGNAEGMNDPEAEDNPGVTQIQADASDNIAIEDMADKAVSIDVYNLSRILLQILAGIWLAGIIGCSSYHIHSYNKLKKQMRGLFCQQIACMKSKASIYPLCWDF